MVLGQRRQGADRTGADWLNRGDPGLLDTMKFSGTTKLRISARPVVLVHGLASNATTWTEYIKPDGYLAAKGLRGFAIGDGQAEGQMFTGDPSEPLKQTSTIAQNADGLAQYIAGVKRVTGAQMVDLVAHSMGGLISRYYIDRLMKDRDVAQLIMLGSPHGGTNCASLPASLGFYLPGDAGAASGVSVRSLQPADNAPPGRSVLSAGW